MQLDQAGSSTKSNLEYKFPNIHPLNRSIAILLSSYTKAINNQIGRTGSLFQQKTKSKLLIVDSDEYALTCFHYIHQNPLRAGLIKDLSDWPYSSYLGYAGLRNGNLVAISHGFEAFDIPDSENFIEQTSFAIDQKKIKQLY